MVLFTIIYVQKEQMDNPENDHATRKSHGHIDWVTALGFIVCTEDPPNLYKIESTKQS
jgi:hypothetical protein